MKYQEALNKTNFILRKLSGWSGKDLSEIDNQYDLFNNQALIQELVDKEIELQSRKDKLVVGSEWECVVPCFGDDSMYYKVGVKVKVLSFNKYDKAYFVKVASDWQEVTFVKDQFLLCFKPKGEK